MGNHLKVVAAILNPEVGARVVMRHSANARSVDQRRRNPDSREGRKIFGGEAPSHDTLGKGMIWTDSSDAEAAPSRKESTAA